MNSVQSTIYGMNEMKKGNLNVKVKVDRKSRSGRSKNLNEIYIKNTDMISEKEEDSNQTNAEIKALEAQINPHFIYNTLDSVNSMAIEHGEFEIRQSVQRSWNHIEIQH